MFIKCSHSEADEGRTRLRLQDCNRERRRQAEGRAPWKARVNPVAFRRRTKATGFGSPLRGVRNDEIKNLPIHRSTFHFRPPMFFRNLTLFRFSPSAAKSLKDLDAALAARALRACGPLELATRGFVSPFGPDSEVPSHTVG